MISIFNLIKCLFILTLFVCCQMQTTTAAPNNDYNDMDDVDLGDSLQDLLSNQQDRLYHQQFRRASLRYHPHILYKKASLRPLIGQNGKITFSKRDDD